MQPGLTKPTARIIIRKQNLASGEVITDPVFIADSSHHSIIVRSNDSSTHTIDVKIAYGYYDNQANEYIFTDWKDLEPEPITGAVGTTSAIIKALTLPYCYFIKLKISGTATSADVIFLNQIL